MSDEPASLLTGTQRRRVLDDFDDVAPAKRRRDQRKIRSRVAAGMADFRLLAGYPDRQFELAFEDVPETELTRALADAHIMVERVRTLRGIEREAVLEAAKERKRELRGESTESLGRTEFRTRRERRREAERAVADQMRPNRWKRLADALLKVALVLLVPASALAVVAPDVADGLAGGVPGLIGATALAAALGIVGVRMVKYDVLPAVRKFASDPRGLASDVWDRF